MAELKAMGNAKLITEEYDYLYHYTTAAGLLGILTSQNLRATNYSFLNDHREVGGFLEDRLPLLIESEVHQGLLDQYQTDPVRRERIKSLGGIANTTKTAVSGLIENMSTALLYINEPFITSFCGVKDAHIAREGLLSQWRGYGVDGGYAIVFDTEKIAELLLEEQKSFLYGTLYIGDVDYYTKGVKSKLEEVIGFERDIKEAVKAHTKSGNNDDLDKTYTPITLLSCIHKHHGFQEESEVRIVAIPPRNEHLMELQKAGDTRTQKKIEFITRNGILIPYIELIDQKKKGSKLPIKKIIIGPTHDGAKRKKSVEMLLKQCEIEAEVTCSGIPYAGR